MTPNLFFVFTALPFRSQNLRHLTKRRVSQSPQNRRLPSRFSKAHTNSPLSTQNGRSSLRSHREKNKEPKRDFTLFKNDDIKSLLITNKD